MPIQMVTVPTNITTTRNFKSSNDGYFPEVLELKVAENSERASGKVKLGVFFSTLAGVSLVMAQVLKGKGVNIRKPSEFFKGLAKVKYDDEGSEVPFLVVKLAAGSVGGGLLGGLLLDKKENRNAKYREAVIQLVGNIATPLVCVWGGMKLYKDNNLEEKLVKLFKLKGKFAKIPCVLATLSCLVTGIVCGNKVGNYINKKAFRVDDKRKLKLSDMSPHIDDACIAITLTGNSGKVGDVLKRIIPAALMIAGYSTGVAQKRQLNKPLNMQTQEGKPNA